MQGQEHVSRGILRFRWQRAGRPFDGGVHRVDHHVSDQRGPIGQALAGQVRHGWRGRRQEEVGEVVSHDPVPFLGHGWVE